MNYFPQDFFCQDGIWHPHSPDDIDYSDGAASEEYLARVLSKVKNPASTSLEFLPFIVDWPSEYHLSPLRANLLRVLPLPREGRALELGSGLGALTRYLGETMASVVAVEGSVRRAALTRQRCRDLPQVEVVAANFFHVRFPRPFDLITLIGVLEYAALYGKGDGDPFHSLLRHAYEALAEHGVLLLAIENRLGLKYLAGAPEDHLGRPYAGVDGYPEEATPRTFGRLELLRLLEESGFVDFQVLLPFPDYKLPTVVVNARFATAREAMAYNLADWCQHAIGSRFQDQRRAFAEPLALAGMAANGLLADHANSFLILAYKRPLDHGALIPSIPWICQKMNILRQPQFCSRTTLLRDSQGVSLRKERLFPEVSGTPGGVRQNLASPQPFIEHAASLSLVMLRQLCCSGRGRDNFLAAVRRWQQFLLDHRLMEDRLPPHFLDCIPDNLMVDAQGKLHYIDNEWEWPHPLPMVQVLVRGLQHFWLKHHYWFHRSSWLRDLTLVEFVRTTLEPLGQELSPEELSRWLAEEDRFQHLVVFGTPDPSQGESPGTVPVSIIIPVFNNLELTRNCLASIWRHTPADLYELIVVDNGSTDGSGAFFHHQAQAARLRCLSNPVNLGFAKACNQGARAARGELLLFLNNDTLVTPGWLEALVDILRKDPDVAAAGAKLLYPDDTVQHAGVVFNERGAVYHLYRHFHRDHPAVNKERDFQVVTGACLLIRKTIFMQAGLFDEGFQNGFEDVDLCLRVRQLGYRIRYTPRSVLYHLESKTPGRFAREEENSRLLAKKWQGRIVPDDFHYYQEDGLRLAWRVNEAGQREAVIHDANGNPFKEQARAHLERGELVPALALYQQALKFNPFDPRNRGLLAELEALRLAAPA